VTTETAERILLVDDDPGIRYTLGRLLEPRYRVDQAATAAEARHRLASAVYQAALIDVQLPDGDGYTLCREAQEISPATDVILMTGSVSEPDDKLYRSLEEGAFYFLFKPFERRVLLALVDRCLRLQRERSAKERYARELADDLEQARRFQRSLVPSAPLRAGGWLVDGRFRPCDALGGDFYLALAAPGGAVAALADVVGHGVGAAMYAGMLRSTLDAARRRGPEPEKVLPELLSGLDFFSGSRFASMVYAHLGPAGRLRYFNAGHPPLLWQRSDGSVAELASTGLVLSGVFASVPRGVGEITVAPGERLLLYSDGLFEAQDPAGRELGLPALAATLAACRGLAAGVTLDRLLADLDRHRGGRPLDDDVTAVVIERRQ
jgi:sigma-B regulation protein RsbU (phosphoserine phosphatase)